MSTDALDKLNQSFNYFLEIPTQQGQDALIAAAEDYREEWIKSMAAGVGIRKSHASKEVTTRYKKVFSVFGTQPDGTEITLSLQSRTKAASNATWYAVSWRTRLKPGGANRRFHFTDNNAWTIDAPQALKMLGELDALGGLEEKYDDTERNSEFEATVVSEELTNTDSAAMFEEITMPEEAWGKDPFFVVINDPDQDWRKILIVNRETGDATFRSTTRNENYMPRKVLREGSEWFLDNSMQDCNVQQARTFLERLQTIVPNLPNRI